VRTAAAGGRQLIRCASAEGGDDFSDDLGKAARPVIEPIVVPDVAPESVQTAYDVMCSAAHRRHAAPYAFDALCALLSAQTQYVSLSEERAC
jgi:hypothetical protein